MTTSVAGSQLLSLLSWTFLPSLLSRFLLSSYYTVLPDTRPRVSPASTPEEIAVQNARAQAHDKNARVVLIASYLLFTLASTFVAQTSASQQNFYTLLGLSRSIVELEGVPAVKSRWRTLARTHHPDKVGKGGEALFVALRRGVDCLSDDEKRWAYERFGPGVLEWGKIAGYREWLVRGAYQSIAFYVFALVSIWLISVLRKEERKNGYWRYMALALTASTELYFLVGASPSPMLSFLLPSRLTFQHIEFLRQFFISSSMALSQLVPLLLPSDPSTIGTPEEQAIARANADAMSLQPLLQQLAQLTAMIEAEAMQMQHTEIMPLVIWDVVNNPGIMPPPTATREEQQAFEVRIQSKVIAEVQDHMVDTFVDMRLRSEQAGLNLWGEAVKNGMAKAGVVKPAIGSKTNATIGSAPVPAQGSTSPDFPPLVVAGTVPPLSEAPPSSPPSSPRIVALEPTALAEPPTIAFPVFSQKDMNEMD